MAYFGIAEFEPGPLLDCLNSIIFFANPDEKHPAHLTLRGPEDKSDKLAEKAQTALSGTPLKMVAVGDFFAEGRQTVYLHCGNGLIKHFWHKPDFPCPVPHVTLYDGHDEKFARELRHRLGRHRMVFEITIKDFKAVKAVPGQSQFNLFYDLNPLFIADILGKEKNPIESVRRLSIARRLNAIERFCKWLETWCYGSHSGHSGPDILRRA